MHVRGSTHSVITSEMQAPLEVSSVLGCARVLDDVMGSLVIRDKLDGIVELDSDVFCILHDKDRFFEHLAQRRRLPRMTTNP